MIKRHATVVLMVAVLGMSLAPCCMAACSAADPSFVHRNQRDLAGLEEAKARYATWKASTSLTRKQADAPMTEQTSVENTSTAASVLRSVCGE